MNEIEPTVKEAACQSCGNAGCIPTLSLGMTPLADILLTEEQIARTEPRYPLAVAFCPQCSLMQLTSAAPPDHIYKDEYPYFTSALPGLLRHFQDSAKDILETRQLDASSYVVEAGSNDGYMLKVFAEKGIEVLGVDPSPGPAKVAEESGIPTICDFFSADLAAGLSKDSKPADVLLANNLLNLLPDPNEFATATKLLLKDDGVAVVEVPYVVEMIDLCAYDNIFHQNRSYWSLTALMKLFGRHDLFINQVERVPTFGGSLRLWIGKRQMPAPTVDALIAEETAKKVGLAEYYSSFAERARKNRDNLVSQLRDLKARGKTIAAYGAAGGMATTILSFTEIDSGIIDFAVDMNSFKHGKYTAGSHIRIYPTEKLVEDMPDYVLLLAWNYADEVLQAQSEYRERGGKFIVPIPDPKVV